MKISGIKQSIVQLALTSVVTSVVLCAGPALQAKDGFGLDSFKRPAEALTKTTAPYRTKFGNPLNVYTIKSESSKASTEPARFLVQGGLHGNELLASEFVGWLAQRFAVGSSALNMLNGGHVEIDFLPFANPDGTIQFTRTNANQINLKRIFDVLWGTTRENPGPKPFSESETRAIRDLVKKRNYTGTVDVHGYVNWIVLPTDPNDSIKGFPKASRQQIDVYSRWQKAITQATKRILPGYEIKTAGSLGDGGAFEDFSWWAAGVPSACLELFSESRYIPQTLAAKIFDWFTPQLLRQPQTNSQMRDSFLAYELFLYTMFDEASRLRSGEANKTELADRYP